MNRHQLCFVVAAFAARLTSLAWSKRNERKLRAAGAREFGRLNSQALALAHLAFYTAAPVEAALRGKGPSRRVGWLGVALYTVAMGMLLWVCRALGPSCSTRKGNHAGSNPAGNFFSMVCRAARQASASASCRAAPAGSAVRAQASFRPSDSTWTTTERPIRPGSSVT